MIYISSEIGNINTNLQELTQDVEIYYAQKEYVNQVALNIETEDLEFVLSIDDMIDEKKNYVLFNTGEIYTCINNKTVNAITSSIAEDGSTQGLTKDHRYNSSDVMVSNQYAACIGFIACTSGDIIRFKNIIFRNETINDVTPGSIYLRLYDNNFNEMVKFYPYNMNDIFNNAASYELDEDGNLSMVQFTKYNFSYIRMSFVYTDEDPIITINETEQNMVFTATNRYYGSESLLIVDTIDKMEDATKKYVLESTGTIWVNRKTKVESTEFTNLADPTSEDWVTGYRLNSSGSMTVNEESIITNFIPCKLGDTIYFSGCSNRGLLCRYYNEDKSDSYIFYPLNDTAGNYNEYKNYFTFNAGYYSANEDGINSSGFPDTAYGRFTLIPNEGEEIIITVNEEIIVNATFINKWVDTGIPYAGTGNNEIITEIESQVSENAVEIEALKETMYNFSNEPNNIIPSYWKKAIDDLEENILLQLDEGGIDSFGFIWGADIHGVNGYTNSNGHGTSVTKNIGYICQYATEKYDLPFVIFSGDIMSQASHSSEVSVHTEHENMWDLFSPIDNNKLLLEKGNHDGAYGAAVNGVYYLYNIGGKEIFNNLFRRQTLDRTRVFGGDGSYFYVDMPKMRVIMLNGHTDGDGSQDTNGYAIYNSMKNSIYGTEQLKWLAEIALNVPENTRIIVSAHQPLANNGDGNLVLGILNAYNNKTSYSNSINISTDTWGNGIESEYNTSSISVDFTNAKGKVLAFFHGHIHKDTIDSTSNTFIIASITTAGGDVRDTTIVERVPNTSTETALDIVIITKEKIYFNRLGAGYDREVSLI